MSVEQIYVIGKSNLFVAGKDLVSGGIVISKFSADGRRESVARIIDDGRDFSLLTFSEQNRIHINYLNTNIKTRLKDGSEPPQEVHEQVEIITKHNSKLLIRSLSSEKDSGIIVLYSDNDSVLWSIALFTLTKNDSLLVSLPKSS